MKKFSQLIDEKINGYIDALNWQKAVLISVGTHSSVESVKFHKFERSGTDD